MVTNTYSSSYTDAHTHTYIYKRDRQTQSRNRDLRREIFSGKGMEAYKSLFRQKQVRDITTHTQMFRGREGCESNRWRQGSHGRLQGVGGRHLAPLATRACTQVTSDQLSGAWWPASAHAPPCWYGWPYQLFLESSICLAITPACRCQCLLSQTPSSDL